MGSPKTLTTGPCYDASLMARLTAALGVQQRQRALQQLMGRLPSDWQMPSCHLAVCTGRL